MHSTVRIEAFPESVFRHRAHATVVCIDVVTASTTAVTAAAQGRKVHAAEDLAEALRLVADRPGALLVGEPPPGDGAFRFDLPSSAAALERRQDRRPIVLFDPPGTRLIADCRQGPDVLVACLRNVSATVGALASRRRDVVLVGAGEGGDFRCEDKMVSARIGRALVARGFVPHGSGTAELIERWGDADVSLLECGRSANRLRRLGRHEDLEFLVRHVDDLDVACRYRDGEIVAVGAGGAPQRADRPAVKGEAAV